MGQGLQYTARRQLATYESRGLHAEFVESLSNVVHHFSGASFHLSWIAHQTAHTASRSWFGLRLLLGSVIS